MATSAGRSRPWLEHYTPAVPGDPLTPEQREIRDLVRDLSRERVAPRAAEIDKTAEFPWDMVELMREHDLLGLPFEERYGGTGTGALMVLVAIEELSKVCATTGLILAVQELGSLGIKLAGTDEQKERWLPNLASVHAWARAAGFARTERIAFVRPPARRLRQIYVGVRCLPT